MIFPNKGQISPEDRLLILSMSRIPGFGPVTFKKLVGIFGSAKGIFTSSSLELKKYLDPNIVKILKSRTHIEESKKFCDSIRKQGIEYITINEDLYSPLLKEIHDPPMVLYFRGDLSKVSFQKIISVVGTRGCSSYGRFITKKIVTALVQSQFTIVSGMAFGIDKIAHESALQSGGKTIAVLPRGVDKAVPRSNNHLFQKILEQGLVVSEGALEEDLHAGMFPSRNRIISGLSLGTIVVEAGHKSGALITAYQALEQGREVFAVPGNITNEKSRGTNSLIKRGEAKLIQSIGDILEEFNIKRTDEGNVKVTHSPLEQRIIDAIVAGFTDVDSLSEHLSLSVAEVLEIISIMEVDEKLAKNEKNGYFVLN